MKDDQLACAPLLSSGGVDWASWTIAEECPEADMEELPWAAVAPRFRYACRGESHRWDRMALVPWRLWS
jgi:hypothetical protein